MGQKKPVALIILDGWGISARTEDNAVALADIAVVPELLARFPHAQMLACGEAVGLPEGVIGNSEVGHLNLGAGRVVYQDLTRLNRAIRDGSFFENRALVEVADAVAARGGRLHLTGLLSDAGVHAHLDHVFALLELAKRRGLTGTQVALHPITDGRDTAPDAGLGFLAALEAKASGTGVGAVATVSGRYYTMDRDKRWERTRRGYEAIAAGIGPRFDDARTGLQKSYEAGVTDEFVEPFCVRGDGGDPLAPIRPGDGLVFWNFRADRARQLTRALTDPGFEGFPRPDPPPAVDFVSMTRYEESFTCPVAFGPVALHDILGQVVSEAGLTQLRIAETEKYAHVTYFFNGGEEEPFPGEERIVVPSARDVATYDLKPEMSAAEVTEHAVAELRRETPPDLVVLNYANPDMVGHTGKLPAAIAAVETVDRLLGRLLGALREAGGVALVTADHGNCEQMRDPVTGGPHTAHTLNPVPVILVSEEHRERTLRDGVLADVAPTLLELLGLPQPAAMTGRSLIEDR